MAQKAGGMLSTGAGAGIGMVGMGLMGQAGDAEGDWWKRMGAAGMAGAMGGPWGAAAGAGLQGITELFKYFSSSTDDASDSLKEEIEAQEKLLGASLAAAEGFGKLAASMSAAEFVTKKQAALSKLGIGTGAQGETTPTRTVDVTDKEGKKIGEKQVPNVMLDTQELKNLETSTKSNFATRLDAYNTRLKQKIALADVGKEATSVPGIIRSNVLRQEQQKKARLDFYEYRNKVAPQVETMKGEGGVGFFQPNPKVRDASWKNSPEGREYFRRYRETTTGAGDIGSKLGERFVGNLGAEYSPAQVLSRQAGAGNDPRLVTPQLGTVMGRNDMISQLTGMSSKDVSDGLLPFFQELMKGVTRGELTEDQANKAYEEMQVSLINLYSNQDCI